MYIFARKLIFIVCHLLIILSDQNSGYWKQWNLWAHRLDGYEKNDDSAGYKVPDYPQATLVDLPRRVHSIL